MENRNNFLLLSQDFRPGKGGIARVARLMASALPFKHILSLHGEQLKDSTALYFNRSRLSFLVKALHIIFLSKPSVIAIDHLYLSRLLVLVPDRFLRKVVIFIHDEEGWQKVKGLNGEGLKKASHILCNSAYTLKKFLEHNPEYASRAAVCMPGGVPDVFLKMAKDSEISNDWFLAPSPYCLFVSRLWKVHRYKGYFELLEAFRKYYETYPQSRMRLAIAGNGDDEEEIASFIQRENLTGKVALFTGLKDQELAEFYKRSACLFFPSSREGFGMVFLEAMFFGKPCLGLSGQPAEDIIVDHETGRLLKNNHPDTLLKAIKEIEDDPLRYKKYGEAGYQRYLSHFTEEHFKNRFLKAIGQ